MARQPRTWNQFELPRALARGLQVVDGEHYLANRSHKGDEVNSEAIYSAKLQCWIHHRPNRKESGHPRPFFMLSYGYEQTKPKKGPRTDDGIRITKKRLRSRFSQEELATEFSRVKAIKRAKKPGVHTELDPGDTETSRIPTPKEVFPPRAVSKKEKAIIDTKTDAWPAEMPKATNGHSVNEVEELQYAIWDWFHNTHLKDWNYTESEKVEIEEQLRALGAKPRTRTITVSMVVPDGTQFQDINDLLKGQNILLESVQQD